MTGRAPTFRLTRFIAVQVRAWPQAIEFYRDVLGLRLVAGHEHEVRFEGDAVTLFVERMRDDAPRDLVKGQAAGKTFFEFEVDDFERAAGALTAAGCTRSESGAGSHSAMFSDPFGLSFHVYATGAVLPDIAVVRLECRCTGRVQGVGFRHFCLQLAQRSPAISGWVRNLDDGSVEFVSQGSIVSAESFVDEIRAHWKHGIDEIHIVRAPAQADTTGFSIRR